MVVELGLVFDYSVKKVDDPVRGVLGALEYWCLSEMYWLYCQQMGVSRL